MQAPAPGPFLHIARMVDKTAGGRICHFAIRIWAIFDVTNGKVTVSM